jgi:voltage-gated potassium channel
VEGKGMSNQYTRTQLHGNAYNLFILVLTLLSLAIMVAIVLPLNEATIELLQFYDNLICIVFLIDFASNLKRSPSKRHYFINERGWLDLLGSIPSFGFFKYAALFRLARISRLARITRLLRGKQKKDLVNDIVLNRGQYAAFVTLLSALLVLTICSVLVLQFESHAVDANITTGGDALWWAIVTITTVGYGDKFPVTEWGRFTGVFVMISGVGIIGALASILSSVLIPPAPTSDVREAQDTDVSMRQELINIRSELAALRQSIAVANGGEID